MHIIHVNKISDPFPITQATNQKAGKVFIFMFTVSNKMQIAANTLSTHHKPAVIKCIWRQIFYAERKKCQAFRSNNCEHLFFQKQRKHTTIYFQTVRVIPLTLYTFRSSALVTLCSMCLCLCHCKLYHRG